MSDILEKSLDRLKDRSGTPVLNDPDSLIDSVMEATEPQRIPMWLTVLRTCSSIAAVLLIGLFIGLQPNPEAFVTTSDFKVEKQYENSIEHYRQTMSLASKVVALKNRTL